MMILHVDPFLKGRPGYAYGIKGEKGADGLDGNPVGSVQAYPTLLSAVLHILTLMLCY